MQNANYSKVVSLIRDAGGVIVGRTRLQKIAYLLSAAGLEDSFHFMYKHYGPYSKQLAQSTQEAAVLGFIEEEEKTTSWGGTYSVYKVATDSTGTPPSSTETPRRQFFKLLIDSNAIELELAATAVFLAVEGNQQPWDETARRKPEKASSGRLEKAKDLYKKIFRFDSPKKLPEILSI